MEMESSMTKIVSNVVRKAYGSSGLVMLAAEMTEGEGEGALTAGDSEYGGGASVARDGEFVSSVRGGEEMRADSRGGRRVGVVPPVVVRGAGVRAGVEAGFGPSVGAVLRDSLPLMELKSDLVGMVSNVGWRWS